MTAIISFIFWLLVIPFCIGLIPASFLSPEKRSPGFVLLSGYFGMWALFALSAVPAVLWVEYHNFRTASWAFTALTILCGAAGIWLLYQNGKAGRPGLVTGRSAAVGARGGIVGEGIINDSTVIKKSGQRAEHAYAGASDGWFENDICVMSGRSAKKRAAAFAKRFLTGTGVEWLLFFLLLGFQLYKAVAYTSFDGDDAYYVVESLIAQEADVMYRILPLTGGSTGLDVRHAMAVFPMWVAFVSVRAGMHATIVTHVVLPLVLIPLTYLLYYEIGKILFGREKLPVFMILMAMFQMFGNVSIYTNETFFLTRTWQGKAVAGALVIPALFWVFLQIHDGGVGKTKHDKGVANKKNDDSVIRESVPDGEERIYHIEKKRGRTDAGIWLLLVCLNMTAGVCSSIAVFLVCILTALTALCLSAAQRDWKLLIKLGATCIPSVIYMAVYVFMAYSYLLL